MHLEILSLPESQCVSTPSTAFLTRSNKFMFSPFVNIFNQIMFPHIHHIFFCKFHMFCTSQPPKIWWRLCSSLEHSDWLLVCIGSKQIFFAIKIIFALNQFQTIQSLHLWKKVYFAYIKKFLFIEWPSYIYIYIYNVPLQIKKVLLIYWMTVIYIWGSLNKFTDFFHIGTFIDSTHMKLVRFEVISSGCNALVVPFQQVLEGPMEVLSCECVNDLRHSLFYLLSCLITTTPELRE